jgi:hypothetical protein
MLRPEEVRSAVWNLVENDLFIPNPVGTSPGFPISQLQHVVLFPPSFSETFAGRITTHSWSSEYYTLVFATLFPILLSLWVYHHHGGASSLLVSLADSCL